MKQKRLLQIHAFTTIFLIILVIPLITVYFHRWVAIVSFSLCCVLPIIYFALSSSYSAPPYDHSHRTNTNPLTIILIVSLLQIWLASGFIGQSLLILKMGQQHHYYHSFVNHIIQQLNPAPIVYGLVLCPGLLMAATIHLMQRAHQQFYSQSDFLVPLTNRLEKVSPHFATRLCRRVIQTCSFLFIGLAILFMGITIALLLKPNISVFNSPNFTYLLVAIFIITSLIQPLQKRFKAYHKRRQSFLILATSLVILILSILVVSFLINFAETQPMRSPMLTAYYHFMGRFQSQYTLVLWFISWWVIALSLPISLIITHIGQSRVVTLILASTWLPLLISLLYWGQQAHINHYLQQGHYHSVITLSQALFAIGWSIILLAPGSYMATLWWGYFAHPATKIRGAPTRHLVLIVALLTFLLGVFNLTAFNLFIIGSGFLIYSQGLLAYRITQRSQQTNTK